MQGARGEAEIRAVLARAIEWLSSPPIRVIDPRSPAHGAILHGVDRRGGGPMGIYTEITGYAVSLFVFLARHLDEPRHLIVAREAGDFLVRIQSAAGAYPDSPDPTDHKIPHRYFSFDTAMCAVGMVRLFRATSQTRYAQSAIGAGRWLLAMQRPDGSFHAMETADGRRNDPGGFFGDGGCLHAKNAIALLEIHSASGEAPFREAAIRACDYVLGLQDRDGAFWNNRGAREVYTHAHCYACEGLLFAGTVLGESRYIAAARRGIDWLARRQCRDGGWALRPKTTRVGLEGILEALRRPHASDAAAQAARLFRLLGSGYGEARSEAVRFVLDCLSAEGGFFYSASRVGRSRMLYTWCTQFAAQALAWGSGPAAVSDLF